MSKSKRNELITCEHFQWRIGLRSNGMYQADGRSNSLDLGRYSLGTRIRQEALEELRQLDQQIAIENHIIPVPKQAAAPSTSLRLEQGNKLYLDHVGRPTISGGARSGTIKRYRAVLDKFLKVMHERGVRQWADVTAGALDAYAAWLDDNGYEYATEYLELTTIKQVIGFLIAKKYLPESCRFEYPLKKPAGTDTYCYSAAEVTAMIAHCQAIPERIWLGDVIVGLAHTGLRISELAQLRLRDIDLVAGVIHLPDASLRGTRDDRASARRTKGKRERELPIHPTLREALKKIHHHNDGRVFHGPRGGILKPDTVRIALIREVIEPLSERFPATSGDPSFKDGRLHSMRHYFCSACANKGVPEQMLMDWLGHRHSSMVKRYYHANREEAQRRMQEISFTSPSTTGIGGEGSAIETTANPEGKSAPGTTEHGVSDQKPKTAA